MDINKAIRKQNKSYKRFMLSMCFIFFMLPAAMYLTENFTLFLMIYLSAVEFMIVTAVLLRKDWETLKYECEPGKVKIRQGVTGKRYNINCEKVIFVHAEKIEDKEDINIIMLTTSRFRNRNVRVVDKNFLSNYGYVSHEYMKIKLLHPEEEFYYIIINKGGYLKYKLLMDIYKNCVKAKYTDEAIEYIKIWAD